MAKKQRIFISYRHQGGIDTARWLRDHLSARGYSVFMDLENLRSGNFNYALYNEIRNCDVFLIVLSNGSLDRCVYPDDWVRHELSFAIQCGIKIIPIIKDDFWFPEYLPKDVDPIRYYNGLRVSYDFFDAFMNKLEEYIAGKPVRRKSPVLPIICICAALLVGGFFLGSMLLDRDEDKPNDPPGQSSIQNKDTQPKETTAPPTTNPPETTVPPTTEPPESSISPTVPYEPEITGNKTTNLCNNAFLAPVADNVTIRITVTYFSWFNFLLPQEYTYWYDSESQRIEVRWTDGEKTYTVHPVTNADCRFLCVTSEWAYFVLHENGTDNLYRAPNDLDKHTFGLRQRIVENLTAQSRVAVHCGYIYCWLPDEGLCRFRTDGTEKVLLVDSDSFVEPTTFQVSNGFVYFFDPSSGIYSVSVEGGKVQHLCDTSGTGAKITHAIEDCGIIYYILHHASKPAELWIVGTDGKNNYALAALPEADMIPEAFNMGDSTPYLRVIQSGKISVFKFDKSSNSFVFNLNIQ